MIRSQLKLLIAQKELKERRSISYRVIEREADVPASTLSRLATDKMTRFEAETLSALCKYFECDIGDLLRYESDEAHAQAPT
jgi:putative transcriptional regulator